MARRTLGALLVALLAGTAPALADGAPDLTRLVRAYPDELAGIEGGMLVWRDGTRMPVGVPSPTDEAALAHASLADMLRDPYPAGPPAGVPAHDPGRYRNAAFFDKMYGRCAERGYAAGLGRVRWMPHHGGRPLPVSRVNGVDAKLQAVSDELDRLDPSLVIDLVPSAGTFNCRAIAGTDTTSAHAYAIAIDISTRHADYWRWSARYRDRIPAAIVEVFERHGFIWGGKWRHFDTMHFEYRPEMFN